MFKDINVPDCYFDTASVIHDLIIKDQSGFNVPLAYYINAHLTYEKEPPSWLGSASRYPADYVQHIRKMMDFFKTTFEWKRRRVQLVVVERCPWVYKRTGRLQEINDPSLLLIIWGIFCAFQSKNRDFVFSIMKPIDITKATLPSYPFQVVYNTAEEILLYVQPINL